MEAAPQLVVWLTERSDVGCARFGVRKVEFGRWKDRTMTATKPAPALGTPPQRGPFAWVGAFTGFYPAQAEEFAHLGPVTRFLYASRSVILVISAQSAVIAGLLAATQRRFEVLPFVLVFVGYVVLHAISNLSNDYFGYRRGHDTEDSPRRRYTLHPIASGAVTPRLLAGGLVVLGVMALAIAAYFVALRGWGALILAVIGAVLLYAYDAAPRALKELGLGEVAAFAVWGPLMIGGGYYVITGQLSGEAFLVSVPIGLGVASILIGKHIDQRAFDTSQHQRTLPVLLGERGARLLNQVAVAAMYVVTAVAMAVGSLTVFALVVVLAAPRALRALRVMSRPAPSAPPAGYVGWPLWYHRVCLFHHRAFGWLFIIGLATGATFPDVRIG
jgi:1,4-dihydroxy-2-naphthoate octaprenyltransferase